jgi:hypothetical protein
VLPAPAVWLLGLNGGSATNRKGNPTGDMSNYVDREAILGGIGALGTGGGSGRKGNPTGDMSNYVDREAVFRGGADPAAQSWPKTPREVRGLKCCDDAACNLITATITCKTRRESIRADCGPAGGSSRRETSGATTRRRRVLRAEPRVVKGRDDEQHGTQQG